MIKLSQKQSDAWYYLTDNTVNEVLYGGGAGCFVLGTLVKTSSGYKPIESIEKGDYVYSFNIFTKEIELKKVLNKYVNNTNRLEKKILSFRVGFTSLNVKIQCTDNHQFYDGEKWVRADELKYFKTKRLSKIEVLNREENYSNEVVYDLNVEDNHNYLVTGLDIIAHNSGKSMLGCVWHINQRMKYAGSRGLIGRAKLKSIEESTLVTLFEVANKLGYIAGIHYQYNAQKSRIHWANGSVSLLKDLFTYPSDPDFVSLGSTEFTDAFIDECTEVSKKAKEIVYSRIRFGLKKYGIIPKLLLTCNPSQGWVKDNYIANDNGKIILPENKVYIHARVVDNPDPDFVRLYTHSLSTLNDYDRARLLDGDWDAMPQAMNPFANHYDSMKHTGTTSLTDKQLMLSIDFNLNPFSLIAAHVWRDKEGDHVHIVDEVEIYKGSIPAMIDEIKNRYGKYLPTIQITGDYNGRKGEMAQRDNASNYLQLQRGLGLHPRQIITPPNPKHDNSRADVNYFLYHFPDFKVSEKCTRTHFDLRNVQCDSFGSIIKRDRSDLTQRGDFLDCFRYLINTFLKKWILNNQKINTFTQNKSNERMRTLPAGKSIIGMLEHDFSGQDNI